MDIKSPSSEPSKSYEKSNTEKTNTEKAEKQEVALKPNDKPKPKNKIERPKIDSQKEPKNKIQREKIDLDAPTKNKIERPKIDLNKETRNKIQREKIDLSTPAKNKIERHKIDLHKESRNKIQREKIDLSTPAKNKIERIPTTEPKNSTKLEVNQLSLEQIKDELTKFNWKTISENWTVKLSANKEITLNPYELPSKENPLYKHKEWLQTAYNHKTWNLNDNGLRTISGVSNATVYKWRKKFNIPTKQPNQKPFKNETHKECGRCHQIKQRNEFELRNDKRKNKPYLRSNCNQCKNELKQIYLFKNKHKILSNIYNGEYKEKCPECETKVIKLPAFDFHHPDKNLKKEQRIRTYSNWMKTKELLEKEKAIPLCKSCHAIKQATVFNKHKELILKKNDFENHLEGVEKKIHQYVRTHLRNQKYDQIRQIIPWIKKRIVIENLYNGKCIGCDEDKLPTLQFHHKDPEQKTYEKWSDLSNLNISKIMEKLKDDSAVCLCANCHSMTESKQFEENMGEIIEKRDVSELKTYYKNLNKNIESYSFPNQPEPPHKNVNKQESLKQPEKTHKQKLLSSANLQLGGKKENEIFIDFNEKNVTGNLEFQYGYGEAWKKYLSNIANLLNEGKKVQTKTLAESVGVNTRNTRKNIQKLISKGLILITGENNNRTITLTEKGRKQSLK